MLKIMVFIILCFKFLLLNLFKLLYKEEALHLASILCKYGYFFSVTMSGITTVKVDGELFRFQAPYFWISTNWNAGNTDYGKLNYISYC